MSYDAGSIESRLDLDRTAFQEGLRLADEEGRSFSTHRYGAVIDLDTARARTKLKETSDQADELGRKTVRPKVDPLTEQAQATLAKLNASLTELGARTVKAKADVNDEKARTTLLGLEARLARLGEQVARPRISVAGVADAEFQIAKVRAELDRLGSDNGSAGLGGKLKGLGNGSGGGIGSAAITAGIALSPALIPIAATLAAGVGALASAFTAAGVGAAGFALLAKPQLEAVTDAQKKLTAAQTAYTKATTDKARVAALQQEQAILASLTPAQREYMAQLNGLKGVYKDLQASVATPVFEVAGKAIHALAAGGELLKPVFQAAGDTFVELAGQFDQWVSKSAGLRSFVDFLTRQTGPAIYSFAHDLANVARGFGGILMAFEPLIGPVEAGLTSFTAKFAAWGAGLGASSGFQHFLDYVRQNAPTVGHMFAELAQAVGTIITQLAPFGPIGLQVITMLAQLINEHPGLVKIAAALLLIGRATSGLAGAAGSIAGIVAKFKSFGAMFSGGGEVAAVEPAIGRIGGALKTLGGGSLVAGGILGGALAVGIGVAVNGFAHFVSGSHEAATAISQLNTDLARTPLSTAAYGTAIDSINAKISDLHHKMSGWGGFAGWFTGSSESAAGQIDKYRAELDKLSAAADKASTRNKILAQQLSPGKGAFGGLASDPVATSANLAIINQMTAAGVQFNGTFAQSKAQVAAFAAAAADGSVAQMALANWFAVSGSKASTAAQKTKAYSDAINAMNSASSSLLQTQDAATKSVNDIGAALVQGSKDFSSNTDNAIQNRGAINNVAQAVMQHVSAMNQQGMSSKQVANYINYMKASLVGQLQQLGLNTPAVNKLVDSLFQIPPSKATNISVPGAAASDGIVRNLNRDLDNIPDHRTITLTAIDNASSQLSSIRSMIANIPTNIPITATGFANLTKLTGIGSANGNILSAFASGGFENHIAQIAAAGAMRLWAEPETGGEAYIPLAASKRSRSIGIWQETGRRLGVMGVGGKTINQTFQYAGPLTTQVVTESRRQLDFAVGA